MHIKRIYLRNFKSFKELTFDVNDKFNVIIGENNVGKSTIFEAILLWKKCYDIIITSSKTKFFKVDGKETYIPFNELSFLRLFNDTDLFYEVPNKTRLSIVLCTGSVEFNLSFEISKPKVIRNSYLRFKTVRHIEFVNFANYLRSTYTKLDEAILIYQTKPVANILSREPFMNMGQIMKKISVGKSDEVLRNKIIQKSAEERDLLKNQLSRVLGKDYRFNFRNQTRTKSDEYIDLKIKNGTKELDIHLQGSGFLQVAEIFSTIGYLNNSINILLVDEPDSHIHLKLQNKLLQELKSIENTQTFLISHNDNFVSKIQGGELYYLNNDSKKSAKLNALDISKFDNVKKELGGTILALDKLNSSNTVCFVEGADDIDYINKIVEKYSSVIEPIENEVTFYHLRGKDFLLQKIETNKRLLLQLFKDKKLATIYDKDFSNVDSNNSLNTQVIKKLGINSIAFSHDGYCIESTLFSNKEKLKTLLSKISNISEIRTHYFVEEYLSKLFSDFKNPSSELFINYEQKFKGQKKNSRPELNGVTFNDFIRDIYYSDNEYTLQYLFHKSLIKKFMVDYEAHFSIDIFNISENQKDDFYASLLFNKYLSLVSCEDDFYPSHLNLIRIIYQIKEMPVASNLV